MSAPTKERIIKMRNAKQLQAKSRQHSITRHSDSHYILTSGSSGHKYVVNPVKLTCSCPFGQYNKKSTCSHMIAVLAYIEKMEQERQVTAWSSQEEAARQHRPVNYLGDGIYLTSRKI